MQIAKLVAIEFRFMDRTNKNGSVNSTEIGLKDITEAHILLTSFCKLATLSSSTKCEPETRY